MQEFVYMGSMPEINCDFGEDVSGASVRTIYAQKPDGTTVLTWSAVASGATAIKYDIPNTSVLDTPGFWRLQPNVVLGGKDIPGVTAQLEVRRRFA